MEILNNLQSNPLESGVKAGRMVGSLPGSQANDYNRLRLFINIAALSGMSLKHFGDVTLFSKLHVSMAAVFHSHG